MFLIGYGGWLLLQSLKTHKLRTMFLGYTSVRWAACSIASAPPLGLHARPQRDLFPSTIELLIALGFASMGIAIFLVMVKLFAILPAPVQEWRNMALFQGLADPTATGPNISILDFSAITNQRIRLDNPIKEQVSWQTESRLTHHEN
jgi:hypothetical protein